MMWAGQNIDVHKSLKEQEKPSFVCEPGDPRVKKYGWTKSKWWGYLSIEDKTVWVSSIWSKQQGKGNLSRLIRNLHKAGFEVKVPNPFEKMESICEHLGFTRTQEPFLEAGEPIDVWVLR